MELHTLSPFKGSKKRPKRVGRGHGSAHGTYSTRGMKGQRARSGGRKGLKLKGMKQMLLRIPKVRGFHREPDMLRYEVNIRDLEKHYQASELVNPSTLKEKSLIKPRKGTAWEVKILGTGTLTKAFTVQNCVLSASAREKIEKAGGTIEARA